MRAQFQADLAALGAEAAAGEMPATQLRGRLEALLERYLGSDWRTSSGLAGSVEETMQEYAELHNAADRVAFLERLQRSLGG